MSWLTSAGFTPTVTVEPAPPAEMLPALRVLPSPTATTVALSEAWTFLVPDCERALSVAVAR